MPSATRIITLSPSYLPTIRPIIFLLNAEHRHTLAMQLKQDNWAEHEAHSMQSQIRTAVGGGTASRNSVSIQLNVNIDRSISSRSKWV
jgi:hypothetical protein